MKYRFTAFGIALSLIMISSPAFTGEKRDPDLTFEFLKSEPGMFDSIIGGWDKNKSQCLQNIVNEAIKIQDSAEFQALAAEIKVDQGKLRFEVSRSSDQKYYDLVLKTDGHTYNSPQYATHPESDLPKICGPLFRGLVSQLTNQAKNSIDARAAQEKSKEDKDNLIAQYHALAFTLAPHDDSASAKEVSTGNKDIHSKELSNGPAGPSGGAGSNILR